MGLLGIRRIVCEPLEANCYLVSAASGDTAVLDPGGDAEAIVAQIEANGLRPRAVLATHGHYDHVGAAAELVERYRLPFAIHSAEEGSLRRVNFCRVKFHGLARVDVPAIDIDLSERAELSLGDVRLAVVHTPGHSPGSVCLEAAGALFTGDTLMATRPGNTNLADADARELSASVRRLAQRYFASTEIHPGHGRPGRLGDAAVPAGAGLST
jgi:hydroxyacylglutathione hydrolase